MIEHAVPMRVVLARALFAVLGIIYGADGMWAEVAPRSFYRSFPLPGWHWISVNGAYNEHLLRDFGGLSLALAVVTVAAAIWASRQSAATAACAWLVFAVPHLIFHLSHLDLLPTGQNVADIGSLSATVVVPLIAAGLVWREPTRRNIS